MYIVMTISNYSLLYLCCPLPSSLLQDCHVLARLSHRGGVELMPTGVNLPCSGASTAHLHLHPLTYQRVTNGSFVSNHASLYKAQPNFQQLSLNLIKQNQQPRHTTSRRQREEPRYRRHLCERLLRHRRECKEKSRRVKMSTAARRRLMRDFKRMQTDPPAGVSASPIADNVMTW